MSNEPDDDTADAEDELPSTAYAVLGILSSDQEMLSVGEIKKRAELTLRHFYWSPAISHIRRELQRLIALGLVEEREIPLGRVRRAQVYQTTPEGEKRLARWVATGTPDEQVVTKNPMLLRVSLGSRIPPDRVLDIIDQRLARVDEDILDAVWAQRRTHELGLDSEANRRYAIAVSDYTRRALYFEQSNLRQLRDAIVGFDTEAFKNDARRPRGPIRHREDENE